MSQAEEALSLHAKVSLRIDIPVKATREIPISLHSSEKDVSPLGWAQILLTGEYRWRKTPTKRP